MWPSLNQSSDIQTKIPPAPYQKLSRDLPPLPSLPMLQNFPNPSSYANMNNTIYPSLTPSSTPSNFPSLNPNSYPSGYGSIPYNTSFPSVNPTSSFPSLSSYATPIRSSSSSPFPSVSSNYLPNTLPPPTSLGAPFNGVSLPPASYLPISYGTLTPPPSLTPQFGSNSIPPANIYPTLNYSNKTPTPIKKIDPVERNPVDNLFPKVIATSQMDDVKLSTIVNPNLLTTHQIKTTPISDSQSQLPVDQKEHSEERTGKQFVNPPISDTWKEEEKWPLPPLVVSSNPEKWTEHKVLDVQANVNVNDSSLDSGITPENKPLGSSEPEMKAPEVKALEMKGPENLVPIIKQEPPNETPAPVQNQTPAENPPQLEAANVQPQQNTTEQSTPTPNPTPVKGEQEEKQQENTTVKEEPQSQPSNS
uniref:Uncharacterized protein n=1 Tax=Arcella intermedia TaxID=1963864 RepID=A0A6B2L3W3_9EUKA